jgi:hypothetical protein
MFSCSRAKDIWRSLGILPYIESAISLNRSGSVVLEEILRDLIQVQNGIIKTDLKELILVGAWYIWWQRREFVKGESVSPPRQSAFSIQALKSNYCAAERKSEPKEVNWCKPPMNSYKLNVDACFFPNGTGAVCTIIRDGHGPYHAILSDCIQVASRIGPFSIQHCFRKATWWRIS